MALPPEISRFLALLLLSATPLAAAPASAVFPRPPQGWLETQIALARVDFSCGSIDGVEGPKTTATLRAYQASLGIRSTGIMDEATGADLVLDSEPVVHTTLNAEDLSHIQPLSPTWLGKSRQTALDYESALEMIAERAHASPGLITRLNPRVDWKAFIPGTLVAVPDPARRTRRVQAAHVQILLGGHVLEASDADGNVIAHFPVSIAREVDKRPVGELRVTVVIPSPTYTFDPALFPESEEARTVGRKLILPPGPRNPVGLVWIGLNRPGYGIHGTPVPERIGLTGSHGCFRLTNWDALILMELTSPDLPVYVNP